MLETRSWTLGLAALALAGLAACGSSGGGGGTESLSAPGSVSLVTADDSGTEPDDSNGGLNVGAGVLPPGSDYFTDSTNVHVYDPSMEIMQTINTILCYVDMTAYDEMLNQGLYKAQTDVSL